MTTLTNELKKRHAVWYAPIDIADMWNQLPSYADATKTYEEWYAAHYVLHGTQVDTPVQGTPAAATTSTALLPGTIKMEDFTSLIETITRTIAQAFATSANMAYANAQPQTSRVSNIANTNPNMSSGGCHYYGEFGHVIGGCPRVQEDIDMGRIRRNIENKVVLPSGAFVPRNVTGATMHLPARPQVLPPVNRIDNPPMHEPTEASQVTNPPSVSAPAPVASSTLSPAMVPAPIHPYLQAHNATYTPLQDRNLGVLPKPPKDKNAAYKTSAPVQDSRIAKDVFNRSMKALLLMLTPEELLSISSEVHVKYCNAVTPHHIQTTDKSVASYADIIEDDTDELPDVANSSSHIPPALQLVSNGQPLQPGVMVIPDPYETYLHSLKPGETPEVLTVAKESHALQSINGLVDNKEDVEGIIDPGSQIISMSEEVCHVLGLIYDPIICLNMQSANGKVDQSLGLVCDVPFQVSDIVLYLQIHVIRQAAYDILLGRPFNVLTESVVRNFVNKDQTITIYCPNTYQTVTVLTLRRGPPRFKSELEDLIHDQGELALVLDYDTQLCTRCQLDQRPLECFINSSSRLCVVCFEKSLGCRWNGLTRDKIVQFPEEPTIASNSAATSEATMTALTAACRSSRTNTHTMTKAASWSSCQSPDINVDSVPSIAGTSTSDFDVRSIGSSSRVTGSVAGDATFAAPFHRAGSPYSVANTDVRTHLRSMCNCQVTVETDLVLGIDELSRLESRMRKEAANASEDMRGWIAASHPSDAVAIGAYSALSVEVARQCEEIGGSQRSSRT
ncbi:hypothetical protein A0H81_09536 [Grifola frondosa]|uniref:Uncharacterized protein n=1 Tax=Grifola frondosa TaxID=5627 RepID=A0A1C7M298_GRIFR|nr:hypothetical protein A0H81_09536 [Grifola frondosa]